MNNTFQIIKNTLISVIIVTNLSSCVEENKSKSEPILAAVPVKVAKVMASNERYINAGGGQINAVNSATLSTRMMGFVEQIPVRVGQKVSKGQLLVSIKNADLQAKRAQVASGIVEAKAAYHNAEKDYQRFVNLFNQNSASQKELDDMTSRYEMAKARYETAQQMMNEVGAQFAYANIRAPFGGVVTNVHVDEGVMANPGMPLVSIEAPGSYEIEAKVAENKINQLKLGVEAQVFVKALNTTLKGKLTELSPSAKFSGGQYLAKVILDNPPKNLLSGMYANVAFAIEGVASSSAKVTVPKAALVEKGQLTGIYTVGPDKTAILRWLRVGETLGDEVQIISGLSAEETYIISYEGKLFNGAKLAIQ